MVDLASAGKAGGEQLDLIPPPTIRHNIRPNYCITSRHGTGPISRREQLFSNHFKVIGKAPAVLYQYFVRITAEDKRAVIGKGIGRVLSRLFQTYSTELAGKKFAYDGEKYLYTVDHLPQNNYQFTVLLEETFGKSENVNVREGTKKSFTVELSYAASVPMQSIALEGANVNNTPDALRVFRVILRQQTPNMSFTDVGAGVVGVQGAYSSFLRAQGGLSLFMDFLLANQSVREPRYVDRVKMFDHLGGHGTTMGAFRFDKGVAAFVDSRVTHKYSRISRKHFLSDNHRKYITISTKSNLVYIEGGDIQRNTKLGHMLQILVAEEEKATETSVTIERAVELMRMSQDQCIAENPGDESVCGGILIGCQEHGVYHAYLCELFKTIPIMPLCLGDDVLFLTYGSGSEIARPMLNSLINTQMTRDTATNAISETMLHTALHSYSTGGETNVLFFYDGESMYDELEPTSLQIIQQQDIYKIEDEEIKHHEILQPLQIHLQHKDYLCNQILFLVLQEVDIGPWTDVEDELASRPGIICASVVGGKPGFMVYRILFDTAEAADTAVRATIGHAEIGDGAVTAYLHGFQRGTIYLANKTISCLIARCRQAVLEWLGR